MEMAARPTNIVFKRCKYPRGAFSPPCGQNLTVCVQRLHYMEIEIGISRSKTHHFNIQMLTPNNIVHYGFRYLHTTLFAAVS